ncbi:hypothetical protein OIE50_16740 [Streptomyces canus]|uniref:hypothetical protein n=1 Tax=Streptomyces canus TaxID=58343 RepID=UPI003249F9EC
MDLAAAGLGRAAQALPVHGQPAQSGALGAAVGEPAAHGPVQSVAVDAGQQSADRRLRRHRPSRQYRIKMHTESFQHLRWCVRDPLADREQ